MGQIIWKGISSDSSDSSEACMGLNTDKYSHQSDYFLWLKGLSVKKIFKIGYWDKLECCAWTTLHYERSVLFQFSFVDGCSWID